MIDGVHALIYVKDARKAREFFRDILKFPSIDAGDGWLIFALPPAELGIHPTGGKSYHELHLMCDDIKSTVKELKGKGIKVIPIHEERWGLATSIMIPGGGEIGLYQPTHPTALILNK